VKARFLHFSISGVQSDRRFQKTDTAAKAGLAKCPERASESTNSNTREIHGGDPESECPLAYLHRG
jgi:hypothetical protein